MTFDRPRQKASRTTKPNMESLGERIAPAVFHPGLVAAEHLAAWRFNAELRHHRHNLVMRQEQLGSVNGPVGIVHKPIVASGPIQGPMLNLMVANSGSPIGTFPVSPKPIVPIHPVTLFNAAIAPRPIIGLPVRARYWPNEPSDQRTHQSPDQHRWHASRERGSGFGRDLQRIRARSGGVFATDWGPRLGAHRG